MTTRYNYPHPTSEPHSAAQQNANNEHISIIEQRYSHTYDLLSLTKLRNIEDDIFSEAKEAWEVLNDQPSLRVDGKTYREIQKCPQLMAELAKIRANAPVYQNLSTRKKNSFFFALGAQYKLRLKHSVADHYFVKSAESISETLEASQAESFNTKKYSKKIIKQAKGHLSKKRQQICSLQDEKTSVSHFSKSKKVCFTGQSAFKYFSKSDPSGVVAAEEQFICQTFFKK